ARVKRLIVYCAPSGNQCEVTDYRTPSRTSETAKLPEDNRFCRISCDHPHPCDKERQMDLKGKRVAVLIEQQYQEMEVWYPVYRLREAGCQVTLVGPKAGETYPSKLGYPAKADKSVHDVNANDFDCLIIPGGFAPDFIRRTEAMIKLVSVMAEQ